MLPFTFYRIIHLDCPVFIWRYTEAMQKFVGGLIECITLSDTGSEVTLVCNDEGKLLGLPLNRPLWDGADVLAGPGFLAGCDNEGNLTSLQTTEKGASYTFHYQYAKVNPLHFCILKSTQAQEKALRQAPCPR